MIVRLATESSYYNLHTVSGFTAGSSLVVTNETSSTLYVAIASSAPASDVGSVPIEVGETYTFSPKTSNLWIRGSTGPIQVDMMTGGTQESPFYRVDFPQDLYTSTTEGSRRLRVDTGQTGFFEGREFRTFFELSLAAGASRYFKFVSPIDFILTEQALTLDAGSARFTAMTGATEATAFSTSLPIIGKNRMVSRKTPYYNPQITISTGGTSTGGTIVDLFRVVASNATAQQQTVLGANSTERGLPAGTYYLRVENIGNNTLTGVYTLIWEERP